MKRNYFFTIIAFLALLGLTQPLCADEKSDLKASMKQSIGDITSLIQDKSIAKDVRNKKIDALVRPLFDFGLMGKLSLGKKEWRKLSKAERKNYSRLFEERVVQSYMSKLDLYTDEVVVIEDPVQVKKRLHLPTYMMRKNEKRDILYKFYKSRKKGWLIYDVDILGVSIIQTYRTQFASILKKDSFDVLLDKLKT